MKVKVIVLSCAAAIIMSMCYGYSRAETSNEKSGFLIGTVSIKRIFEDCKRNKTYREEATAEQNKIVAELEKLSKEIDADKAGLKTLKSGTADYMKSMKELLDKQARYEAQQEFYKQQLTLKDQKWTEELYKNIIAKASDIAKEKGLDMVFEISEPEFPSSSANELMLAIRTHKVLYCGKNCVDISEEIIKRVDSEAVSK